MKSPLGVGSMRASVGKHGGSIRVSLKGGTLGWPFALIESSQRPEPLEAELSASGHISVLQWHRAHTVGGILSR